MNEKGIETLLKQEMQIEYKPSYMLDVRTKEKIEIEARKSSQKLIIFIVSMSIITVLLETIIIIPFIDELILKILFISSNLMLLSLMVSFSLLNSKTERSFII